MDNTNDSYPAEKKEQNILQVSEKQSNSEPPIVTKPADPSQKGDATTGEPVANEKKPTRQMTGGPDKPTA